MIHVRIKAHDVHNRKLALCAKRAFRQMGAEGVALGLEVLADEVRARAPIGETGDLRASVRVEAPKGSFNGQIVIGEHYAMFVEFGTSQKPARPFIRPAADAARRRIAALILQSRGRP